MTCHRMIPVSRAVEMEMELMRDEGTELEGLCASSVVIV